MLQGWGGVTEEGLQLPQRQGGSQGPGNHVHLPRTVCSICKGQGHAGEGPGGGPGGTASLQAAGWGCWEPSKGQTEPQAAREAMREGRQLGITARPTRFRAEMAQRVCVHPLNRPCWALCCRTSAGDRDPLLEQTIVRLL